MGELHVITTGKDSAHQAALKIKGIIPFVTAVHVREKTLSQQAYIQFVRILLKHGIPKNKIIANTYAEAAGELGLKGVHLPEKGPNPEEVKRLYPELVVGCSVHSKETAVKKEKQHADYLFYGNVFSTSCKPGLEGKGLEQLSHVVQSVSIPVIAIGGIHPESVYGVRQTGALGVAVMSGIMNAEDPVWMCQEYVRQLKEEEKHGESS
ncbi:thiazole tautomerase (transcriptional regulator TenI) [Scopulibacillus daqui]|uniref:Thiazole tautomerase (Transcriptional regulator TenI) n=1 Tax=Scopulibacillus daqui TaxID=1469162 RepID=A0ABS2PYF0_9BACL|nr:thiazole tautomerase (transcriptional regulator TenI) [Scopulibacillus daqui]